jgi:hypothetical protein
MSRSKIERVSALIINGTGMTVNTPIEAIQFLNEYSEDKSKKPSIKYEIIIRYNTGDKIEATFKDKKDSIKFLETYR